LKLGNISDYDIILVEIFIYRWELWQCTDDVLQVEGT
jgi:hypothetical protein